MLLHWGGGQRKMDELDRAEIIATLPVEDGLFGQVLQSLRDCGIHEASICDRVTRCILEAYAAQI